MAFVIFRARFKLAVGVQEQESKMVFCRPPRNFSKLISSNLTYN